MRTGAAAGFGWGCWVVICAAAAGCSGQDAPCGPCVQVAGRWVLDVEAPLSPCPGSSAPPQNLELQQVAASLEATWDGGTASGTLFDSQRFSLHGRAAVTQDPVSVRAFYAAGLPDGGMDRLLDGSWSWTSAATGCAEIRRFTAQRQ